MQARKIYDSPCRCLHCIYSISWEIKAHFLQQYQFSEFWEEHASVRYREGERRERGGEERNGKKKKKREENRKFHLIEKKIPQKYNEKYYHI